MNQWPQAQHGHGHLAELGKGAHRLQTHALVFIDERIEKDDEQFLVIEAIAGDERVSAVGAQGAGGIGPAAPRGFELMMAQAAQENVLVAALEAGQRAAQRVLCPALGVGFLGIGEEAIEGGEEVGHEIGEAVVFRQTRGLGDDEVIAVRERFFDEGDAGRRRVRGP